MIRLVNETFYLFIITVSFRPPHTSRYFVSCRCAVCHIRCVIACALPIITI